MHVSGTESKVGTVVIPVHKSFHRVHTYPKCLRTRGRISLSSLYLGNIGKFGQKGANGNKADTVLCYGF